MQELIKFCSSCGQENHISAACCHSCQALFLDLENIKFKDNAPERAHPVNDPDYSEKPRRVVVIDFDMKFGSMVIFMIKWAIAAIPAMIVLFMIGLIAIAILGGMGAGLR